MDTIEKALLKKQESSKQQQVHSTEVLDKLADHMVEQEKAEQENTTADTDTALDLDTNIQIPLSDEQTSGEQSRTENTANCSQKIDLDLEELLSLGFLVPHSSHSVLNEEYRQIKRPLLRNIRGKSAHPIDNANIIQVTSSMQAEGKTFTAINLALTFAMEMDFNVLLVDADSIRASMSKTLLKEVKPGLTNYLSGNVTDLSSLMLKTNIPKLTLLPAGSRNLFSNELLNSEFMESLITEFSQRYTNRIVVIDSPPMLQSNDARILAQKVGQIVFVVEQNKTAQNTVKSAIALLEPEMVVGLVLNKSRTDSQSGYYGYYGHYGSAK